MTLEELRDEYTKLQEEHKTTLSENEILKKDKETMTARIKELQDYNNKLFSKYVLSDDVKQDEEKSQIDDVIDKIKENYK